MDKPDKQSQVSYVAVYLTGFNILRRYYEKHRDNETLGAFLRELDPNAVKAHLSSNPNLEAKFMKLLNRRFNGRHLLYPEEAKDFLTRFYAYYPEARAGMKYMGKCLRSDYAIHKELTKVLSSVTFERKTKETAPVEPQAPLPLSHANPDWTPVLALA